MRTWKFGVIVAALLLPVSSAIAFAQTQAAMNGEACDAYTRADAELNAIYQQILREYRSDALFIRNMRTAQRTWVTYRDAHLAALYPATDPQREYGSVYPACRCTALTETTRRRTEELRRWTRDAAEGDVCAGSVRARSDAGASSGTGATEGAASLFGRRWTLIEMGERSFATNAPHLYFDREQRRFSGSGGCNRVFGGFRVNGADLRFTAVASTRRACADAEAQGVEASFLRALEATTRFQVQGDILRLYADDRPILTFRASATGAGGASEMANVTGTVTYRQRIALTPSAIVEVKLLDVSRADAPAVTIAEQTIRPEGRQVPIEFELRYDPRRINPRHRYTVQARILEDGRLRFISTQAYPVITGGNSNTVEVIVNPAR